MIFGQRIRFRAPERSDIPNYVTWFNDPEVRAGMLVYLPMSMADEEIWFENMLKNPAPERPMIIEVQQQGTWAPIGACGVVDIDWRSRVGELGILIGDKRYWNQGYGTEAMQLLLLHGFETLNLNRICLQVYATNPRAIRCYEKAGFVHEGCKRQAMYKNGQYFDILLMSVLRSEWTGHQQLQLKKEA
jgi:diamine N-acetyltransferase